MTAVLTAAERILQSLGIADPQEIDPGRHRMDARRGHQLPAARRLRSEDPGICAQGGDLRQQSQPGTSPAVLPSA